MSPDKSEQQSKDLLEAKLTFAGTVVVTFEGANDKTRMRLVGQGIYFDGLDSVDGHRAGWEGMLDALSAYLQMTRQRSTGEGFQ